MTALELHGARIGGLCWFGQTGIGWFGKHHCFFCYLLTEFGVDWSAACPLDAAEPANDVTQLSLL